MNELKKAKKLLKNKDNRCFINASIADGWGGYRTLGCYSDYDSFLERFNSWHSAHPNSENICDGTRFGWSVWIGSSDQTTVHFSISLNLKGTKELMEYNVKPKLPMSLKESE